MTDVAADGAIGMIEVMGLSRGLRLGDIATSAAAVRLEGIGFVHSGIVMVTVRGDVASVRAAVDAAVAGLGDASAVHAVSVLARPAGPVTGVVTQRSQIAAAHRSFGGPGGIGGVRVRGPLVTAATASPAPTSIPIPASASDATSGKARRRPRSAQRSTAASAPPTPPDTSPS